jgi:hypothetical protein
VTTELKQKFYYPDRIAPQPKAAEGERAIDYSHVSQVGPNVRGPVP